jgi:hypothetical protein
MLKHPSPLLGLFSVARKQFDRLRGIAVVALLTVGFVLTYLLSSTPLTAHAATNNTLNFQARLESASGAIVPDGTYDVTFHLFNASSSGGGTDTSCTGDSNCLWEESYTYNSGAGGTDARIHVANGYVTVNLGSITAFPNTINWDQQLWLTMDIGGTTGSGTITWDGQMNPRLQLTAVPYALRAGALASPANASGYDSTLSLVQPAAGVSGNEVFQVPDMGAAGTYTLLTSGNAIQLQSTTPGVQQNGYFNINGTGIVGTLYVAPGSGSIDTSSAGTLNIGTSNATGILLGQNVTFANGANRSLVIAAAASGVGNQLTIHAGNGASGSTGGNLLLEAGANGTASGTPGSIIVKANGGDSTTAFQVQNAAGNPVFNIDSNSTDLVTNGSFEANTSGWATKGGASITANGPGEYGNKSLDVTTGTASGDGVKYNVNLTNGHLYAISFYIQLHAINGSTASGQTWSSLNFGYAQDGVTEDAAGLSATNQSIATATNGQWYREIIRFTPSAVSGTPYIYIKQNSAVTTSREFYVDGVQLEDITNFGQSTSSFAPYSEGNINISGKVTSPLTIAAGSSTAALQVLDSSYGSVFTVDARQGRVGIGNGTPSSKFMVQSGATDAAANYSVIRGTSTILDVTDGGSNNLSLLSLGNSAGGLTGGTSSGEALQVSNQGYVTLQGYSLATATGAGANAGTSFNLQGATGQAAGGAINTGGNGANLVLAGGTGGASTGSATNSSGGNIYIEGGTAGTGGSGTAGTGGSVIVKPLTNSTTAFQVQDAGGNNVLSVDTTNKIVTTMDHNIGSANNLGGAGRVFADGFESGNFNLWAGGGATSSGTSTAAVGTSTVRNGRYAAQFNETGSGVAYASMNISGSVTMMAREYVYITSASTGFNFLSLGNSTLYRDNATSKLSYYNGVTSTSTIGSTAITTGTWHEIEEDITTNSSTGSVTVYLDGTSVINLTNQNTGTNYPTYLGIGDNVAGRIDALSVDDVSVDTARPGDSASLNVADSLHVAGTSSFGSNVLVQTTENSSSAFQVQNAASDQVLNVSTAQSSLVANPSFEAGTTNWTGVNSGTLSQNTNSSNVYYGNDSLAIALGATSGSGAQTSTYTNALGANTYALSFMAKGSAAISGLTASLGSGTCTLNVTTVNTSWTWYYCSGIVTTAAPVVKITATTTSQTLYLDGVELDQTSGNPLPFISGSANIQGSLVVNGSQLQAANSAFALTVNELNNGQASGGGGLFIQGNSNNLFQNSLVVANSAGQNLLLVNSTDNNTTINGGSAFWNTAALAVNTIDSGATALSVAGASSSQTANIVQVTGNGLTTGNAVNVSSTSATQTSGSLLNVSDTATLATSGSSISGSLVNISRSVTANVSGSSTLTPTLDNGSTFATYPAATSQTDSFTVNAGYSNYYMVIGVFDDLGQPAPTVTYAGTSATLLSSGGIGNGTTGVYLYGLKAPTTGTNNLVITAATNPGEWTVAAEDYYNVNQTTPTGTVPTQTKGTTSPASITATSVSGDVVTDFLADTTPTATQGSGQTTADHSGSLTMTFGPGEVAQSYKTASGSSTTMQWTGPTWWGMAAVDLKGASGSSESVTSAVTSISNNCTTTVGTCTDGTNVLQLNQNYSSSTGAVLNIQNSGAGNLINATGSNTAFQIQPNGNLIISNSLNSPTTAIRLRAATSGDNIETAGEDLWLSGWTNANFTGTQLYYARGDLNTGDLFVGNAQLNGTSNSVSGSNGATMLVLDNTASGTTGDPLNAWNGSMYYNANMNEFRCYQNSEWRNCVSAVHSWAVDGFSASGSTASATYANWPGTNNSITFSKDASSTNLLVHIELNPWVTTAAAELGLKVKITNGSGYSSSTTCGDLYYNYPGTSQHIDSSCSVIVSGAPSGSLTAVIQWARIGGTGTMNSDPNTWGDMTIQETD